MTTEVWRAAAPVIHFAASYSRAVVVSESLGQAIQDASQSCPCDEVGSNNAVRGHTRVRKDLPPGTHGLEIQRAIKLRLQERR